MYKWRQQRGTTVASNPACHHKAILCIVVSPYKLFNLFNYLAANIRAYNLIQTIEQYQALPIL